MEAEDSTNETGFDLSHNYIALNITAAVLYLLLVIIPSAILFLIILHYYFKTEKTPLNLIVINYCIAALISNVLTGLVLYVAAPISLDSMSCYGSWLLIGLDYFFYALIPAMISLLAVTQCNTMVIKESSKCSFNYKVVLMLLFLAWAYSAVCGIVAFVIWTATNTKTFLCENLGLMLTSETVAHVFFSVILVVFMVFLVVAFASSITACILKRKMENNMDTNLDRKMLLLPMLIAALFMFIASIYNSLMVGLLASEAAQEAGESAIELFGVLLFQFIIGPMFAVLLITLNDDMRKTLKGVVLKKTMQPNDSPS